MVGVRVPSLVVTFPTAAAAMSCEECCERRGLPGRMIPVPGEVAAGCGLAWKAAAGDRDELVAALSRLPKVQLRRLLMHTVVRLPVREIARREGCSERAVKYSLARARRRMRALLTDGD